MVPVSQFESSVTKPDVCFLRGGSGDFSLVDDIFSVTVSFQLFLPREHIV